MTQLSLFETTPNPNYNFWKEMFGFEVKVGDEVRIDEVIGYCETLGETGYCYSMTVNVIEINDDEAKVETTKEWETACGGYVENSVNNAGNIWRIKVKNLAPNFRKK